MTVARSRAPKSTTTEAILEMYGERPLPPVPRFPSSIYASGKQGTMLYRKSPVSPDLPRTVDPSTSRANSLLVPPLQPRSVAVKNSKSAKHLSQLFKKEPRVKPGTRNIHPIKQHLIQRTRPPSFPKPKVEEVKPIPVTEWKPPLYKEPSLSSKSSAFTPLSHRSASLDSSRQSPAQWEVEGGRSGNSFVLPDLTHSGSFDASYHSSIQESISPPRSFLDLKAVTARPNIPYPIRTTSLFEEPQSSHFSPSSSSSSDVESSSGVALSLRSRAKKALLPSKVTKRSGLKQRLNSSQSEISSISTIYTPPASILTAPQPQDIPQQSLLDSYDTLQDEYTLPGRAFPKRPQFSKGHPSSPLKENMPTEEIRNHVLAITEFQKQSKKAQETPNNHAYVYRVPRKRLSIRQVPTFTKTVNINSPDTTYKIEMPTPRPPERLESDVLFDQSYHIELPLPKDPSTLLHSSADFPTRTDVTGFFNSSHPFNGSTSALCHSECLTSVDNQKTQRYSLPISPYSRQTTCDSLLSEAERSHVDLSSTSKDEERSLGQTPVVSRLTPALAKKETKPAIAFHLKRERVREKRDGACEETARGVRSVTAARREELKKQIVVMGNPSAVGVPF